MQPDMKTPPAILSVAEYAAATGQTVAAVLQQIKAGTCPVDSVILRKPNPDRVGSRPRYAVTRASVDRLLGLEASP